METKKHNILVSLMCMDFLDIKEQLKILEEEMDGYHIDIMDGGFCQGNSSRSEEADGRTSYDYKSE